MNLEHHISADQGSGRKALVLSFHNWETRRQGGLHVIGEALVEDGWSVVFWSLSRTYWGALFSRDERLCWKNISHILQPDISALKPGSLTNLAILSHEIYGERLIPGVARYNTWARSRVWNKFRRLMERSSYCPDLIVIESCEALYFYEHIKKLFPSAKMIYRVSDPIIGWTNPRPLLIRAENKTMEGADLVLFVNKECMAAYRKTTLLNEGKIAVLKNGIDIDLYGKRQPRPSCYPQRGPVFCYVGAKPPAWDAVCALSSRINKGVVVVVCPVVPTLHVRRRLNQMKKILYIPGIFPGEVPAYLQHSDVVIVPYPDSIKRMPISMHSKLLQAMACSKPIVSLNAGVGLERYGVHVATDVYEFVELCLRVQSEGAKKYKIDLDSHSWIRFKREFIGRVRSLGVRQ